MRFRGQVITAYHLFSQQRYPQVNSGSRGKRLQANWTWKILKIPSIFLYFAVDRSRVTPKLSSSQHTNQIAIL